MNSFSFVFIFTSILLYSYEIDNEDYSDLTCSLTGISPVNVSRPFPNLAKCYKYNYNSCCTILHDDYIKDFTEALLPPSCLRKYIELEDLLCLPCSPKESLFIDHYNKIIYICVEFAKKLWNATDEEELAKPSTRFDNCGFIAREEEDEKKFGQYKTFKWGFIMPSIFANFTDFCETIQIPYYEDKYDEDDNLIEHWTIKLRKKSEGDCFSYSIFITINWLMVYFIILVVF